MSIPTNETSRPLMRLVDQLGTSPDLGRSDGSHWRLIFAGAVLFALNALPGAGWVSSTADQYARLLALCLGPTLVSSGASGLLMRRGNGTLSLWFSILEALLSLPMLALLVLLLYEWLGLHWTVGVVVAACTIFYVVRLRRARQ